LGAVKLNKILWLADLSAFYETGEPITEARYIKREFGPVPARIVPVLRELEQEGVLTVRDVPHFNKRKKEYDVRVTPRTDFMTPQQKKLVDEVIQHVCDEHTAASVSEATHDHIWKAAEDGEELPLFTVFAKPGKITENEREWARLALESVNE
jgi:CBS domain-containing protein